MFLADVFRTILFTGTTSRTVAEPEHLAGLWLQWLNWFSAQAHLA